MIDQGILDELWNADDPAASEAAIRVALATRAQARARTEQSELQTQLARAIALQGRFDEAAALLIEIPDSDDAAVGIRVMLESARMMLLAGNPDVATSLLANAEAIAAGASETFLRLDALHELANIEGAADAGGYTDTAISLAEAASDPRERRWLITLHSDRGWRRLSGGDASSALESFADAARCASLVGTPDEVSWTAAALADHTAALAAITAVTRSE